MNVRERVARGQTVRVTALADEIGVPRQTVYGWIEAGILYHIKFGRTVLVTAQGARPLLGMTEPAGPLAA